jgi:hypothetical protein
VPDSRTAIWIGFDRCLKASEFILLASEFSTVPVVEFSEDGKGPSFRCPLLELDISVALEAEAIALVTCTSPNIHQASLSVFKDFQPSREVDMVNKKWYLLDILANSQFDIVLMMLQIGIVLQNLQMRLVWICNLHSFQAKS